MIAVIRVYDVAGNVIETHELLVAYASRAVSLSALDRCEIKAYV
jgi:hypothetical protein